MKFDWEKFKKEKIAVRFDNEDELHNFANEATKNGIINVNYCVNKRSRNNDVVFDCAKDELSNSGYILDWGYLNSVYYNNFTIVKWVKQNEELYPELKEGMIIEIADKSDPFWYIRKVSGELIATNENTWFKLDTYNNDLTNKWLPELNIVKIYESGSHTLEGLFNKENLVLIWERKEEIEEMTLEEICKALGKKIKIKED